MPSLETRRRRREESSSAQGDLLEGGLDSQPLLDTSQAKTRRPKATVGEQLGAALETHKVAGRVCILAMRSIPRRCSILTQICAGRASAAVHCDFRVHAVQGARACDLHGVFATILRPFRLRSRGRLVMQGVLTFIFFLIALLVAHDKSKILGTALEWTDASVAACTH